MKLIIFDLDGTVVNSDAYLNNRMQTTFAQQGLPVPDVATLRSVSGLSLHNALAQLSGRSGDELEALVLAYRENYFGAAQEGSGEPLFEGMAELIQKLSAMPDFVLGIATGKGMRGVDRVLDLHNLQDHFVTRQTPDHNPSKPHPGMLLRAMDETGARADETIMLGDTSYDMEMARAAGVRAIGVNWGMHDKEILLACGAMQVVDQVSELEAAILAA